VTLVSHFDHTSAFILFTYFTHYQRAQATNLPQTSIMKAYSMDQRLPIYKEFRVLSLCLCVTHWYRVKTAEHIVNNLSPSDSTIITIFSELIVTKFLLDHPKYGGGV